MRGLELSVLAQTYLPLTPGEIRWAGGWISHQPHRFNQSCLYNEEGSVKSQKDGVQRADRLVKMGRCGERGRRGDTMDTLMLFVGALLWAIPELQPLLINLQSREEHVSF